MWIKLDDRMPENIKVIALSDAAFRAYIRGLCYCGRNLTDGFIPDAAVREICGGGKNWRRTVAQLATKGPQSTHPLWEPLGASSGYYVHDWETYNPTRSKVEEQRQKTLERVKKFRFRDA